MDSQFKTDILLAIGIAYAIMMGIRFWPRIQAKMLGVPFVTAEDLKQRLDRGEDLLIIDVRMSHEFNGVLGHIDGALNLESRKLNEKLASLGEQLDPYKNQQIVITCQTGFRSTKAARILFQHGFSKMAILKGGMRSWAR